MRKQHELPVRLTSLYVRIPKTPRTEPGKNDLHYCQRTTASGDCRLRPAGAERSSFGNRIFGWAIRLYVSKRKTRAKSITASLGRWYLVLIVPCATACSVSLENPNNRARGFVVCDLNVGSPLRSSSAAPRFKWLPAGTDIRSAEYRYGRRSVSRYG